ncbi:UDP-3-O-(3-hydroxymyristoyl)glucosamine N-acyltransferase [Gilvimarinus polysaccharolyticus]|uniref:UDP-3-O-(3-hydroxymyristoyl)glucosamine N-acyltransferase n=1 Tax=Gilvimarinus polysaccharolyticus TaxID=863921 RepID=UPI0006734DB6|nr:UDP-3-O-(3-hydroxymyristoyl)glucosamine N-acyltransferase [Gilvimarinus polysaccharolyticus]
MTNYTLRQLADYLSAEIDDSNAGLIITGIAGLAAAKTDQISFLAGAAYIKYLSQSQAGAVMLRPADAEHYSGVKLLVDNPYLAYARLSKLFDRSGDTIARSVHASAVVAANVRLGSNVSVGANAVIDSGVVIGDDVIVGAGCYIGADVSIGDRTRLFANVSIYHAVVIGQDSVLHSGCVIGSDGFGFAPDKDGSWCKIHQLGSVIIGNRVEIGASTAIDRGALDDTVISDGVKIDNQVHIAHNCRIGEHTAIAANCGIAGSTVIGRHCTMAGAVGITGHIEITDNVHITGMSMVTKSITVPGSYSSGNSAIVTREWRKNAVRFNQLNQIAARLKALERDSNK